jgi:hypothetical protein
MWFPSDRSNANTFKLVPVMVVLCGLVFWLFGRPAPVQWSNWPGAPPAQQQQAESIVGAARPVATVVASSVPLAQYHAASTRQDAATDGSVRFFRRSVAGGTLDYFLVQLADHVHVEVLNADGATPGSDASGDTVWTDGKQHGATVEAMARAPYAARDGMDLLGAMAFGFHGARTSDEGTVVINGAIQRVNPWRAALCLTKDGAAKIGLFDAAALAQCQQAIGGGPVILLDGKIANPDVQTATDEFVPFNPLNENFVQLDWRKKVYTGTYPKTAVGIGKDAHGGAFIVLATSYGMDGVELARQLKAMGCTDALGGDDDTSTQAVWRGQPTQPRAVRPVPDAIGVWWKRGN